MKTITRLTLSVATILAAGGLMVSSSFAQTSAPAAGTQPTQLQKDHARRAEVHHRLVKQNKRITKERKEGEITKSQAKDLRANDKAIHGEEKAMAKQDGGHITKTDQKALNQQLNQNSKEIGK